MSWNERVGRRAEGAILHQLRAQTLAADLCIRSRAEQRDHRIDEARVVLSDDAEGVADDIVEAAFGEIELDMPGFLFSEPSPLSLRRERKVASAGFSPAAPARDQAPRRAQPRRP